MLYRFRKLIGLMLIRQGWRIYPDCPSRAILNQGLTDWAEFIANGGE